MSIILNSGNQYVVDGVTHERREWITSEDKLVREKLRLGWSAGQIANELEGRSRNAVIGYINRAGLRASTKNTNQHARTVAPAAPYERKPRAEPKQVKPGAERRTRFRPPPPATEAQPEAVNRFDTPPDGIGVSLLELTNVSCRWPKGAVGEPGFTFCGDPSADLAKDRPYCAHHMRRAHE